MDMRNTPAGSPDARSSIGKALDLLRAFGEDARDGLGVSELARRARLSKSTAHRLLGSMAESGAIAKSGKLYRRGSLFARLQAPPRERLHDELRELLTPHLADLYAVTRHTVHLAAMDGADVYYLNKLHGAESMRSPVRIGGRAPAYSTAVGKAMLAFDQSALRRLRAVRLIQWTPMTLRDISEVTSELSRVRSRGTAEDHGETVSEVRCVAAPVIGPAGYAVAALSVSWNTDATSFAAQEEYVHTMARRASRTLTLAMDHIRLGATDP